MESNPNTSSPKGRKLWWNEQTTAIVTGANRGIGYHVAKRLAESGLIVILTARDPTRGLQAVESLRDQGLNVHFGHLDVSDPASVTAFATWFEVNFGVLDILMNNAAVSFNGIQENSVQHADTVIKTNFFGPKKLTETLLPLFRCCPSKSRILNISSRLGLLDKMKNPKISATLEDEENLREEQIEGIVKLFLDHVNDDKWETEGWPETWTDYAVSKMALNAYSKVLAKRLKDRNIVVNCFCPGFTQTSMTGGKGSHTADAAASIASRLVLAHPDRIETGKFFMAASYRILSRF